MYEARASCKDIARAPVTNWKPRGVTFAGYYAVRYGMKVQLVNSVSCHSLATLKRLRYAVTLQVYTHPKTCVVVGHSFRMTHPRIG